MGYFNLAGQARHPRIFSRQTDLGSKPSIEAAISAWKMDVPTTTLQNVPIRQTEIAKLSTYFRH